MSISIRSTSGVLLAFVLCAGATAAQPHLTGPGGPAPQADSFDTDGDGFNDNSDNCTLVFNPDQRDSNGDGYGNVCDGDLNNDEQTQFQDVAIMKNVFFQNGDVDADLNGDQKVNFLDLGQQKSMLFDKPGPTGAHPSVPACNCYFSGDCLGGGQFCDWGPAGFTVEDVCWWRTPKPQFAGNGCSTEHEGSWGPICDGYCTSTESGSSVGHEDRNRIAEAIGLWGTAMLAPSIAGGGPVNERAADAARSLEFEWSQASEVIARHAAHVLSVASGANFYDYFCHYEHHPESPGEFVNLAGSPCRIEAAGLALDAIQAELREAGRGAAFVAQIPASCAKWEEMFTPACAAGPGALECFGQLIEDMGVFLTTPRARSAGTGIQDMDLVRLLTGDKASR